MNEAPTIKRPEKERCLMCGTEVAPHKLTDGFCADCLAVPRAAMIRPQPPIDRESPQPDKSPAMHDGERILFQLGDVVVTPTRCFTRGMAIVLSSVVAVAVQQAITPKRNTSGWMIATILVMPATLLAWVIAMASDFSVAALLSMAFFTALFIFCFLQILKTDKTPIDWLVILSTAAGPVELCRSPDKATCDKLALALSGVIARK